MIDMIRPPWDQFLSDFKEHGGFVLICTCKCELWTYSAIRSHWQAGHFDYQRSDWEDFLE